MNGGSASPPAKAIPLSNESRVCSDGDDATTASPLETVEVSSAKQAVLEFNKKIIWKLCPDLLDPPLPVVEALRYPPNASGVFFIFKYHVRIILFSALF